MLGLGTRMDGLETLAWIRSARILWGKLVAGTSGNGRIET